MWAALVLQVIAMSSTINVFVQNLNVKLIGKNECKVIANLPARTSTNLLIDTIWVLHAFNN